MPNVALNLSVEDSKQFDAKLKEAQKFGLKITGKYAPLGVASGTIEKERLADLKAIPGLHVEEERAVFAQQYAVMER